MWILIMVINHSYMTGAVTMQEFTSKENCEKASSIIINNYPRGGVLNSGKEITIQCTQK